MSCLCYDTLDKKEWRESLGRMPLGLFLFFMGDDRRVSVACFIDLLIEVAVFAVIWIIMSIIIIIGIIWTHKW